MARTVTRSTLCTRVQQRADVENDTHVSTSEINDLINEAIPRVWDILVSCAPPDYYLTEYAFSTVAGTIPYALPADFYKVRRLVEDMGSGRRRPIESVNDSERGYYEAPAGVSTMILRYIPVAPTLGSDVATFDGVNGWEELIVLEAAIDVIAKQERDPSALMAKRAREEQRIRSMAYRDAGSPQTIRRVGKDPFSRWERRVSGYQLVGSNIELYSASSGWP